MWFSWAQIKASLLRHAMLLHSLPAISEGFKMFESPRFCQHSGKDEVLALRTRGSFRFCNAASRATWANSELAACLPSPEATKLKVSGASMEDSSIKEEHSPCKPSQNSRGECKIGAVVQEEFVSTTLPQRPSTSVAYSEKRFRKCRTLFEL